jgi:predicted  nucleic acid-binding Zn-ribbon protein
MADKYTKKAVAGSSDWKDTLVEKEHQPPKVKSTVSYKQLENQVANIDTQIANLGNQKAEIEAEMAKVKKAVEA